MGIRRNRFLVGVALLLGCTGLGLPAAQATTALDYTFVATVNLAGPLGYPCIDGKPCPPTVGLANDLVLFPGDPFPQGYIIVGNTRTATITSTTCVTAAVNVNKVGKAPAGAGACDFSTAAGSKPLANTVSGHCGFSSGQYTKIWRDGNQRYLVDIHATEFGGLVALLGHVFKLNSTKTGTIVGSAVMIPPMPGGAGSCLTKTATTFTLVGTAAVAVA